MTALLDVNVLIALSWRNHAHHSAARQWFTRSSSNGWATTPITEVGFVRISSDRRVMHVSTTPATALAQLEALRALPGHAFWPDDVPLVVGEGVIVVLCRATALSPTVISLRWSPGTVAGWSHSTLHWPIQHPPAWSRFCSQR